MSFGSAFSAIARRLVDTFGDQTLEIMEKAPQRLSEVKGISPEKAAAIGEDAGTVEEVYEPYLVQNGLIVRTPRGRMVTDLAYRHLGVAKPAGAP